jgi:hypothetical protein
MLTAATAFVDTYHGFRKKKARLMTVGLKFFSKTFSA